MSLKKAVQGNTKFAFPGMDWFSFSGLPGLLSGSLPDRWGNQVIDTWLAREGKAPSSFDPVQRLCLMGARGLGALEFSPQVNPGSLNRRTPVDIMDLMESAHSTLIERSRIDLESGSDRDKAIGIESLLKVASFAGGSAPKAIVAVNGKGQMLSGQTGRIPKGYSHWILKFDGVTEKSASLFGQALGEGRVEHAYSLMATAAGIQMPECRLFEENGRAHFLSRRFDRGENGKKLHMQTLGAVAHFGWNPPGRYGYEHVFQVMRKIGLGKEDQEQLYRRMVFNAMARNTDDHIKNFSFLMDEKGGWRLSPGYGLTYSYNPTEYLGSRHRLSINGKKKDFTMADFLTVADAVEISRPEVIIEEIMDTIQQWPLFARESGVSEDRIQFIGEEHLTGSL